MHIILTGGGTAGHVMPNLALIPVLQAQGCAVSYIGTDEGIEHKLICEAFPGLPYHCISAGKLRRYASWRNLSDPFRAMAGVGQTMGIIKKIKPDAIFSKGGFVSLPVVIGARLRGVPAILHESDMSPGLANRLAIPYCQHICTSFAPAAEKIGKKAVFTGTPLRDTLFNGKRANGLSFCHFSGLKPILLVTGGSLGARAINECLRNALNRLTARFDIIHLCGAGNVDDALETPSYRQFAFVSKELPDLLAAADLVLSRAGSNTLCELLALAKPHLLIPLPLSASRGDQLQNAAYTAAAGLSTVLPQEQMTAEILYDTLCTVYQNRDTAVTAMRQAPFAHGTRMVADLIIQAARTNQ